jgi:phosphoesterase RecJ-like protein
LADTLERFRNRSGQPCEILPVFLSEIPEIYHFLLEGWQGRLIEGDEGQQLPKSRLDYYDRVVVVDTHTAAQLPGLADYFRARSGGVIVIDHHQAGEQWGHCRLIDTAASATGELIYRLIEQARWKLELPAAQCLFAAIGTDSGWFRFESTHWQTFEIAARLVRMGIEPGELYHRLFESFPPSRILLGRAVLGSLELLLDDRLAIQMVSQAMLTETGAQRWQSENLVNRPLEAAVVTVSILLTELEEDKGTRVSLRSRYGVSVNEIAQRLGGGGHEQAAGATLKMPLDQARQRVIDEVSRELATR